MGKPKASIFIETHAEAAQVWAGPVYAFHDPSTRMTGRDSMEAAAMTKAFMDLLSPLLKGGFSFFKLALFLWG